MTEPVYKNILKSTEIKGPAWVSNGDLTLGQSSSTVVDGVPVYTESGGSIKVIVEGVEYTLTRQILSWLTGLTGDVQTSLDSLYDSIAATDGNLALKADTDYVDTALLEKVDNAAWNDNNDSILAFLDTKPDFDYVDAANTAQNTVISGKASTLYVNTQLATKADITYVDGLLSGIGTGFATESYVDSQNAAQDTSIATKADLTYVDTQLATKASTTSVSGKADLTYVDTQLATKASTASVSGKADLTYVDTQLSTKASTASVALKADITYVDGIVAGSGFATTGYVDAANTAQNTTIAAKRDTSNTTFSTLTSTGGTTLHSGIYIDGVNWLRKNTYFHGVPAFFTYDQSGDNQYHVMYRDAAKNLVIDSEHYTNAGGGGVRFKLKEVGTSNVADVLTLNPTSISMTKPLTTSSTICGVSSAELGRLIGVTSAVQTQLDAKCTQSYCDTANAAQNVTITTKANDSDTVHKTSNETITGRKTFFTDSTASVDNIVLDKTGGGAGQGRLYLRSGATSGAYNGSVVTGDMVMCYGGNANGVNTALNIVPWSTVNSGTRWYGQTVTNTAMAWTFSANSSMAFACPTTFTGNVIANGQTITPAVLGNVNYLSGVTQNVQTQLNNRVTLDTAQTITGVKTFTNGFQTAGISLAPSTTSIPCASLTLSYGSAVRQHHCTAGYIFHKTGAGNTNAWPITVSQYSVGSYSDNADTYLYLNPAFSVQIFQNAGYGGTPQTFNANMVPQSWAIDTPNTMSSIKVYYYGTEITIPGVSTA